MATNNDSQMDNPQIQLTVVQQIAIADRLLAQLQKQYEQIHLIDKKSKGNTQNNQQISSYQLSSQLQSHQNDEQEQDNNMEGYQQLDEYEGQAHQSDSSEQQQEALNSNQQPHSSTKQSNLTDPKTQHQQPQSKFEPQLIMYPAVSPNQEQQQNIYLMSDPILINDTNQIKIKQLMGLIHMDVPQWAKSEETALKRIKELFGGNKQGKNINLQL